MSLAQIMNDTLDLVIKSETLQKLKSQIILRMVQQTTECGWFIRDYLKIKEFCSAVLLLWLSRLYIYREENAQECDKYSQ